MAATFDAVPYLYPTHGHAAWGRVASIFRDARRQRVDALMIGDSQSNAWGDFVSNHATLVYWLNRSIGCRIPGTGILPPISLTASGNPILAASTARFVGSIGTIDYSKYAPKFTSRAGGDSTNVIDIDSSTPPHAVLLQPDAIHTQMSFDDICQGGATLLDKDDTWRFEGIVCGCPNASIHGGSAGDNVKATFVRSDNPKGYTSGDGSNTVSATGQGLSSLAADTPVRFDLGPGTWSSSAYLSAYPLCAEGGKKIRYAGGGLYRPNAPGFVVHNISEGSYRTGNSTSMVSNHANCKPFLRCLFPAARPRLIICELGENDFGNLTTAAAWKSLVKNLLDFLRDAFGGGYAVLWVTESPRGDTSNGNYATIMTNRNQQAGVLCEVRDEGYPELFVVNYQRFAADQGYTQLQSTLSGLTYLGDFRSLVMAAGPTTITQNVHYVQTQEGGGKKKWWLYTGATTTIGTAGVISSLRYGPGGDLAVGAPVNENPCRIWRPLLPGYSKQVNSDGAPDDFVHPGALGSSLRFRAMLALVLGACAAAPPAPWRSRW